MTIIDLERDDLQRMAELVRRYADRPLGAGVRASGWVRLIAPVHPLFREPGQAHERCGGSAINVRNIVAAASDPDPTAAEAARAPAEVLLAAAKPT